MNRNENFDAEAVIAALPRRRVRPLAAALAMVRLIIDPQDTAQVARMEIALAGKSQHDVFRRFAASDTGRRVLAERRSLVATLDNHAYLRALPANSLGRHYLAFMEREGLSAQGLLDATPDATARIEQLPEPMRVFCNYTQRGPHDLHHVLLGYGREELGEICVLAMAYQQLRLPSYKIISWLGRFVVVNQLRQRRAGGHGVFAAVREAEAIGRKADWILTLDIEASLPADIDELRTRLAIPIPRAYRDVIDRVRETLRWRDGPLPDRTRAAAAQ
jgi:ubiquinone biosynthesis protein COQ4